MRVAFIGRMGVGKDYLAAKLTDMGFVRLSFSDPLHELVGEHVLCRKYEKGEPGIRSLLQQVGAAARGDDQTPSWLQKIVNSIGIVDWGNQDFFVVRLRWKMQNFSNKSKIIISDCRHQNEISFVKSSGFTLYGVACSEETRRRRLNMRGESISFETERHISERLSTDLQSMVDPSHIIWNDVLSPSNDKFIPYKKFLKMVANDSSGYINNERVLDK